jgi:subtilisin family serine protease
MSADFRIKPDVMALGDASIVVDDRGNVTMKSGTSIASPIMCGMVACLWQAFPALTNTEILEAVRESGNRYGDPNRDYGYGIPDMEKAAGIAQKMAGQKKKK